MAIVGRPNVGKSALFNRLVGRRVSIVHEEEGVTRDRIACEANWDGERFELLDTGGLGHFGKQVATDQIVAGTEMQAEIAIGDASFIIFVVDITAGLAPLDEEVARILHESGRTIILAANKADNPEREEDCCDFDQLGFPVFPVSAVHNRGINALMEELIPLLPKEENPTEREPLRVAVVGRPNAGKSSYINRLLRDERVIVSDVPGTTRDSIEIPFAIGSGETARHYQLIDTAGVQKDTRGKSAVDWFSNLRTDKSIERADVVVIVLDAETGPTTRDKKVAAKVIEAQKGCILLINKWDLAKEAEEDITQTKYLPVLRETLPFMGFAPVLFVSAKSGYNIKRSIEAIDYVAAQTRTEITTGVLNRVIQQAVEKYPPPVAKGKRLKVYYATQSGTNPIYFKVFVNNPDCARSNWLAYLQNQMRAAFGLEGAPIFIKLVARSRPIR
ncbi:ribosome biogenesis GTPase Der [Pontiella sulfatireligans]|uniref:ribosome biogenesis GTPase Der n=1 Tax=Pontiella sulfatireligans TaxID=2750658 RepID=UPI0014449A31|nr:ribosome biogenesis GTPase Der [Pontiella sulfatireligans]